MRVRLPALLLAGAALVGCNTGVDTSRSGKGSESDKGSAGKTDSDGYYYTIAVKGMH